MQSPVRSEFPADYAKSEIAKPPKTSLNALKRKSIKEVPQTPPSTRRLFRKSSIAPSNNVPLPVVSAIAPTRVDRNLINRNKEAKFEREKLERLAASKERKRGESCDMPTMLKVDIGWDEREV
jgi:hypothetical protein